MVYTKKLAIACSLCVISSMLLADEQATQQQVAPAEQGQPQKISQTDNPLFFVDVKFEDFLARVVPEDIRTEFNAFYAYFIQQTQGMTETEIRKVRAVYYDKAIAMLQKDHPEWLSKVQPYYNNPLITLDTKFEKVRMVVGSFLIRCGVYADYCTRKSEVLAKNNQVDAGVWSTVTSYMASLGNTIAGWFGFGQPSAKQVTA